MMSAKALAMHTTECELESIGIGLDEIFIPSENVWDLACANTRV